MDDLIVQVTRTGGTKPSSFPHLCPFQPKGASKEFCMTQTQSFPRNRDGCYATKCNSELRKCIMCLALNRPRHEVKYAVDPKIGFCVEHADSSKKLAPEPVKSKMVPPVVQVSAPPPPDEPPIEHEDEMVADLALDVPLGSDGELQGTGPDSNKNETPAPSETPQRKRRAKKVTEAVKLDEELVGLAVRNAPQLKKRQLEMFKRCGLGMGNVEIAALLNTTRGSIGVEFATVYAILGLKHLGVSTKRPTAVEAAKRYFAAGPEYRAAQEQSRSSAVEPEAP